MGVPLQGPDDLCMGRSWALRGDTGDMWRLRLRSQDGLLHVEVSGDYMMPKEWENLPGWDRHQYFAVGSWNNFQPTPMTMDVGDPGNFRCRVIFDGSPGTYNPTQQCYEYKFQINIDGIPELAYYPMCDTEDGTTSIVGKYIVFGPLQEDDDTHPVLSLKTWTIRSRQVGAVFEINFVPRAPD